VGVLRRDSMAMKPFAGYNFADYFAHWLSFDKPGAKLPGIFHVNWFRKGEDGSFLWPGFGDNLRVLEWMLKRVTNSVEGVRTPIGTLPARGELNLAGLGLDEAATKQLLDVDVAAWQTELTAIGEYLDSYGARMPQRLKDEQKRVASALAQAAAPAQRKAASAL
jgi:phosphoenolpyruvate carboxykinase (GTP)